MNYTCTLAFTVTTDGTPTEAEVANAVYTRLGDLMGAGELLEAVEIRDDQNNIIDPTAEV